MKTAVNRLRGVERDIVQAPQPGDVAPYYETQGNEIAVFEAAYKKRLPVMLKGPTGCGKTRFLEYMAFQLKRPLVRRVIPRFDAFCYARGARPIVCARPGRMPSPATRTVRLAFRAEEEASVPKCWKR